MATRINWSKELLRQAKKRFPNESTAFIAKDLGFPFEAFKKLASRRGWHKTKKHMRSLGRKK